MEFARIGFRQRGGMVGAEIDNVDLSQDLDQQVIDEIAAALAHAGVIFFRNQNITPDQHEAFAKRFGELTDIKFVKTVDGHANMSEVRKEPDDKHNIGGGWHADQTFHEIPPLGAVLVARELPDFGGDTLFSSMAAAYESLSPALQRTLDGLNAVHGNQRLLAAANKNVVGRDQPVREVVHPVVIRNRITGRKSLYVNAMYTQRIEGWTEEESAPLLGYLYEVGRRPEFQTRFTWETGAIAFWDNSQVWHYAVNDYHGKRRFMHRLAIKGEPFLGAADAVPNGLAREKVFG